MNSPMGRSLALVFAVALLAPAARGAPPEARGPAAWRGCCGLAPWAQPGPMKSKGTYEGFLGGYSGLVAGSTVRHHTAKTGGIPAPYTNVHNPLPATPENAQRGASVYAADCASCHGEDGRGDGPGSRGLKPPPAELGWLARVPTRRLDAYMDWTVAEGGPPLGTAMPSFKGKLSDQDIWAVIGYIQARLPKTAPPAH